MREASDIAAYEGLVFKTAEMFSAMVGLEREDMQQELRIKIIKAKRTFDPRRSKMTERAYIFSCVTNLVKDLKKHAARRSGIRVEHIEDHVVKDDTAYERLSLSASFEFRYMHVTEAEAYRLLEAFTMPATVTAEESRIAAFLVMGYDHQEVADLLGVAKTQVTASVKNVREKLADWRPDKPEGPPVPLPVAPPVAAPAAVAA